MGNSLFANCCRHVTDLIFQTRSCNSPDERSPLLPKTPLSCAVCLGVPGAAPCAGPYPDIIPSEAVTGSLQPCTEHIQDLSEAKDEAGAMAVSDQSCLRPLRQAEASRAVAVLPADLGEGPAGLLDHAQLLEACQSCVKLEDGGVAHRSCRREEHVAAADGGDVAPGARPAGRGRSEGRAALRSDPALASPDSVPERSGAAPSPASPGTPSSAVPARVGSSPPARGMAVPPSAPGQDLAEARDASAGSVRTDPAACPGGRPGCDPGSRVQALPSKQHQQKKRRKKKKLALGGAQRHGTVPCFV